MSDAELVLRARGGDQLAFRRLIKRFESECGQIASEYFLWGGERGDLKQEAAHGLVKAVRDYRPDGGASFRTFACLCIRRQVITAVKAATREKHGPLNHAMSFEYRPPGAAHDNDDLNLGDLLPSPDPEPQAALETTERIGALQTTLADKLTQLERVAILGIAEGVPYEDIAASAGIPFKSVDNAAQRARRKLAAALENAA